MALNVFLTALAIVDDIGAVLVIAVFYTGQIDWSALGAGVLLLALLAAANGGRAAADPLRAGGDHGVGMLPGVRRARHDGGRAASLSPGWPCGCGWPSCRRRFAGRSSAP